MTRRRPAPSFPTQTRTSVATCWNCTDEVEIRNAIEVMAPQEMAGQYLHRGTCASKTKAYFAMHRVRIEGRFVSGNDGTRVTRVASFPELSDVPTLSHV